MVIAKDLMENKFYTINGNEPVTKALSFFEKTDTLVVTEDKNKIKRGKNFDNYRS